jgi:hypothetical protein
MWRLISQLSLNSASLVEEGAEGLQELLRLHNAGESAVGENHVQGIKGLTAAPCYARLDSSHGITFARGHRVEIEFDEEYFTGGGVYLRQCPRAFPRPLDEQLRLVASPGGGSSHPRVAARAGWAAAVTADRRRTSPERQRLSSSRRCGLGPVPRAAPAGASDPAEEAVRFSVAVVGVPGERDPGTEELLPGAA